jgi:GNAT superfamily N-acetyltransferase
LATLYRVQVASLPRREAYWLLWLLGVHRNQQGEGIGSALLAHMHHRLDAEGQCAHVHAPSEDVAGWLNKRGYHPDGDLIRYGQAVLYPMTRPPAAGPHRD